MAFLQQKCTFVNFELTYFMKIPRQQFIMIISWGFCDQTMKIWIQQQISIVMYFHIETMKTIFVYSYKRSQNQKCNTWCEKEQCLINYNRTYTCGWGNIYLSGISDCFNNAKIFLHERLRQLRSSEIQSFKNGLWNTSIL